ncbi:MAG TPA: glutamine amidotransferase [Prosthecobacter sp.]|nr:glutamine amidotransferase [Prosthecobacter sp.]
MTLLFQSPERAWLAAGIIGLGIILLVRGYWRSPLRGGARAAALACKAASWSLLALLVADPVWSRTQPKAGENELVVAADNSASLAISEQAGRPTRAARMKEALNAGDGTSPPPWLDELSQMFRVKTQLVGERLQNVASFGTLTHDGQKSELSGALRTLRQNSAGSRLAAVVLISDGNPTDKAAWQPLGKAPVYAVLVGEAAPSPDLALLEPAVTQTPFEDTPVTITARVLGHGFAGKEVAVAAIDEDGKAAATEKLLISKDGEAQAVRLRVPAVKPGVSFFRLAVMEAPLAAKIAGDEWKKLTAEATLANNERRVAVDRGAGPYRVLYLSGRPNWEYKFIRRAIAGDAEIQMPSLIRIAKREPKFEWRGRAGETSNPLFRGFGQQGEAQRYDQPVLIRLNTKDAAELSDGFPKTPEALLGEYRAIIVDDLEAEFFTQEQMHLIERFVSERGGALLMLGGQECYQAGGYDHTPVGRMLPVYLDRVTQSGAVLDGRLSLTREGWLEPWTRLRATREDEDRRLAQMPGFFAVNQVFSIKPGASVLATVSDQEQAAHPALIAQRFGEGRVAAVTIADMWRWGMRDEEARKDLDRAWRQLLRWLVVDVPDRIQFTATPEGERVTLAVRVRDEAFRAMDDAVVKIEVAGKIGNQAAAPSVLYAEPSLKEAGLFEAEYFSREPGFYRATATVERAAGDSQSGDKALGAKATGWVHDPGAAEYGELSPGHEWMTQVAKDTGGQLLKLEDLHRLPELLKQIRVPVEETVTQPLWHAPWVFALMVGLLVTEWWLRRKGGMA